jgi:hypothetical protein
MISGELLKYLKRVAHLMTLNPLNSGRKQVAPTDPLHHMSRFRGLPTELSSTTAKTITAPRRSLSLLIKAPRRNHSEGKFSMELILIVVVVVLLFGGGGYWGRGRGYW